MQQSKRNDGNKSKRNYLPDIHFAPSFGWMNDPNGLVFHDGVYELYYQHNPDGIEWNRMTWGHASSTDMLHWEEQGDVLFPDENGTMYSGSAIINEHERLGLPKDALLYFYTAAGHISAASAGKPFSIRMAQSLDGGKTLVKRDGEVIPSPGWESRDPKVFYHAATGAYIMVVWISDHDFGIWRSEDLVTFRQTQVLTLEGGFECPDLFQLPVRDETGKLCGKKYVFWAADGSYYVGSFDGYQFRQEQSRKRAYMCTPGGAEPGNTLPYAAQSFSGMGDRVVSIAWLRTRTVGGRSTGAMSIPRELSLVKKTGVRQGDAPMESQENDLEQPESVQQGSEYILRMSLPAEITQREKACLKSETDETFYIPEEEKKAGMMVRIAIDKSVWNPEKVFFGAHSETIAWSAAFLADGGEELLHIDCLRDTGTLQLRHGNVTDLMDVPAGFEDLELIYDRGILEGSLCGETVNFILDFPELRDKQCTRFRAESGIRSAQCFYV